MENKELQERAIAKAVAKIFFLEREIDKYVERIGYDESLGHELISIVIEAKQREVEVWKYIIDKVNE